VIDLSEQEGTEDGRIGVGAPSSATWRTLSREPSVDRAGINPDGEARARDECFVILRPVADAVLGFGLVGHASELSRGIASVTICATTPHEA
jgi:hypothetical protein